MGQKIVVLANRSNLAIKVITPKDERGKPSVVIFKRWYQKYTGTQEMNGFLASTLALPCAFIDLAEGFGEVTKWLAYNNGDHIREQRPPGFKWKHLHMSPPDFVGR
ncbi:hypothetical protein P154DRAFT_612660 [Amniculicola lignicola CBS 123094]|uniref:Uncharacterized protein n=1 Tax=Amniculicola lignicola CBS 123094 TaxID=1392246 RepID=A0A6A5W6X8_9PLEO|nr:hypothetical protein P154DRAFT_612660 [Amniculicola lignicola CBS 123094]